MTWQTIAAEKQAAVKAKIPKEWILEKIPRPEEEPNSAVYLDSILPQSEVAITDLTLTTLASKIAKGEVSSLQVVTAFCHRAAFAHQLLNCCSEIFFDKAFERAKELDEYYKQHGKTIGPLHGIPISLKDQVNLPGLDSSIGYVALLNKPKTKEQEATIAVLLRQLGAVFYVKSTVPMAMMSFDTFSNAYGQTLNSINRRVSPGGSSGGEGALLGSKSSVLGLGTDIGGSIRVPASFNGLYGLRPSFGRLPYQLCANSYTGQTVISSVIGPLARDLDDVELFTKSLVSTEPWLYDSKCVPIPWRPFEVSSQAKFSFGIMEWDGVEIDRIDAPVQRAIKLVADALTKSGHDTIEWVPQNHQKIHDLSNEIFEADCGEEVHSLCAESGEPCTVYIGEGASKTVSEHWADTDAIYELKKQYFDYWNSTKDKTSSGRPVDAWISPVWPQPSFVKENNPFPSYTVVLNVLDCSVVVVPVTISDSNIDNVPGENYDPQLYHGTPVGVQLITRRLEEEKAIALAKVLRDVLKN